MKIFTTLTSIVIIGFSAFIGCTLVDLRQANIILEEEIKAVKSNNDLYFQRWIEARALHLQCLETIK